MMLFEFFGVYLFRLFGTSDTVMAAYPVACATLSIPLTYLLACELGFTVPGSLVATGLFATAMWHFEISRLLYDQAFVGTLALALCWITVVALRRGSIVLSALAGLVAGGVLISYLGGRALLPIGFAWSVYLVLVHGLFLRGTPRDASGEDAARGRWRRWLVGTRARPFDERWRLPSNSVVMALVFVATCAAVVYPAWRYYHQRLNRGMFIDPYRTATVNPFGPHGVDAYREKHRRDPPAGDATMLERLPGGLARMVRSVWQPTDETIYLEIARYQLSRLPFMLFEQGDASPFYRRPLVPLLDPFSELLLVPALVYCVWRWRRPGIMLILLWTTIALLTGQVFTIETPNIHRAPLVFPFLQLLLVAPLDAVFALLERRAPRWSAALFVALMLVVVGLGWRARNEYYVRYPSDPVANAKRELLPAAWTRLANRLPTAAGPLTVVLYVEGAPSPGWQRVYVPSAEVVDGLRHPDLADAASPRADLVLFASPRDEHITPWRERHPAMVLHDYRDRAGKLLFTAGFTGGEPELRPTAIAPAALELAATR